MCGHYCLSIKKNMMQLRQAILILGLLSVASVAKAVPIELDGNGFTVQYESGATGLYKQGELSGSLDTVYFWPNTFSATSGGGAVTTQASLVLNFTIKPGFVFDTLWFTEGGDYSLFGDSQVGVATGVEAVNAATSASASLNLSSGSLFSQTGGSTDWELGGSLTSADLGAAQSFTLTLDNTLTADATGGLGYIQKTYAGFRVLTQRAEPATVPEPASGLLLLVGAAAAVLVGGRRRVLFRSQSRA